MGLFGSSKPRFKQLPDAAAATNWRRDFINSWSSGNYEYPLEEVAGLTPLEQQNLADLEGYLANGTEGWNLAMNETRDTLNMPDSAVNNPAYQSFMREQERLRGRSASSVRRRAQLGGSMDTAPASIAENEMNRSYDDVILQRLWDMEESIRNRKERAAGTAAGLGQQQFGNVLAGDTLAQKERMIQQAQNTAIYQQQLQTFLLPFTYMANIASQAVGQGTVSYMDYKPGVMDYIRAGGEIASGIGSVVSGLGSLNLGGVAAGPAAGTGTGKTGMANAYY